jgi:hypothetical protein
MSTVEFGLFRDNLSLHIVPGLRSEPKISDACMTGLVGPALLGQISRDKLDPLVPEKQRLIAGSLS